MTTPTERPLNPNIQEIDGTVYAELYVDGVKVTAENPLPTTGGGSSGGGAVTVANGADVAEGATTDAEATGNGSVIAILKRIRTLLGGTLATSRTWTLASGTDTVTVAGTVSVSNLPTTQPVSVASTVPVSGSFWQATQPVSLASNTPDVTDRAARLLGHVTVDNVSLTVSNGQTQPLTDTQLRASAVPVSLATNTPTLAAGTNTIGNLNEIRAATSYVTNTGTAGAAVTLTLNAAGSGLFHYITSIEITAYAAAARTGGATPWLVTTTNITGSPVYTFSTAGAIGTTDTQRPILATPLKTTTAATNTTIIAPAATGVIWRINVTYFVAA